jgi:predicted small lipoprotein YifL
MRRTVVILALLTALTGVGPVGPLDAPPAAAHACTSPVVMEPKVKGTVNIGVAAEAKPVVKVDINVPSGFDVDEVRNTEGWTYETVGRPVTKATFSGGPIPPFECRFFSVFGVPTRKAKLLITLTTHADDGTLTQYRAPDPFDLYPAVIVYAGVDPGDGTPAKDTSSAPLVVGGVAAGALAAGGFLFMRRRRPPRQRRRPPPAKRR